jgi:hypothetical protein
LGTPQSLSLAAGAVLVTFLDYRTIYALTAAVMLVAAAYLRAKVGALRGSADGGPIGEDLLDQGPAGLPVGAVELELGSAAAHGVGAQRGEDLSQLEPRSLDRERDQ